MTFKDIFPKGIYFAVASTRIPKKEIVSAAESYFRRIVTDVIRIKTLNFFAL